MSDGTAANLDGSAMCFSQKQAGIVVKRELNKTANRLEQGKIACIFQLQVVGIPCNDKRHPDSNTAHFDYFSGGSRLDVPGALHATITSLETALAQLKAMVT